MASKKKGKTTRFKKILMSIFDDLAKEVKFGLEGRNDGIPMF